MRHIGDITKISGYDAPTVNVVIGGSPCQDLSIAGKRAGLAGERSGLFMEQIRIIKEMRRKDAESGRSGPDIRPRFMVWENVPGAFSSNRGADFGAVLQETAKVICEEAPAVPMPESGWPTSGCLTGMGTGGDTWSIAWRVFDAQFWGVPQRRRRIALVADFGGLTAPEILFERKSLSRDSDPGRTPRQEPARDAQDSSAKHDSVLGLPPRTLKIRSGCKGGGKGALIQIDKSATLSTLQDQTLFQPVAYVLNDQGGGVINVETGKTSPTLRAESHNHEPNIVYCIQGNAIDRSESAGCNGSGYKKDISYTLNTVDRQAVAFVAAHGQSNAEITDGSICPTLNCNHGQPIVFDARGNGDGITCPTITGDHENRITDYTAITVDKIGVDIYNSTLTGDIACSITASTGQGSANTGPSVMQKVIRWIVRRLTPLECERLQGFPDNWTDIGAWMDTKGKIHKESSDSARYKALGNSIALPSWYFVLFRLSCVCGSDKTMASLFDGIGGFPLIWEHINGKGSCLWASEIEEFPIAVTKKHFPD